MLASIDKEGKSTIASSEAQVLLALGDTQRASEKFAEAGRVLEENIANVVKQSEKDVIRFLAATQYFKGGHYAKALAICQKIQASLLPNEMRATYERFLRDVKARNAPDYAAKVKESLGRLWHTRKFEELLEVLREHAYVVSPAELAFCRATVCEQIEKFHEASLFFADLLRFLPNDQKKVFFSAAYPLRLFRQGKLDKAWQYVEHLLAAIPHAATFITASLIRYHQACAANGNEQTRLYRSQIELFE